MMTAEIVIASISFAGTLLGTIGGILASCKLVNYRLEQLEEKVGRHNNFAERMPIVEERVKIIDRRLEEIEKDMKM